MSRSVGGTDGGHVATVVVECDAGDVDPDDRVRDIDQLSPADRREFLEAVADSNRTVDFGRLAPGDVVRFTAYYRVV